RGGQLDGMMGRAALGVAVGGGALGANGTLERSLLPLLTLLAGSAFLPISEIAHVSRQLADTFASAHRLRIVHDEPVLVADGPGTPARPAGRGAAVRLEGVSFTYPGRQRAAVRGVSLDIRPGTTVALVG